MSKVKVHRHAAKYLQRLPKDSKKRIKDVLKRLEVTPLEQPDVRHMVGEWAVGIIEYESERFGSFFGLTKKTTLFMWITSALEETSINDFWALNWAFVL
jgi:hypothetical protein